MKCPKCGRPAVEKDGKIKCIDGHVEDVPEKTTLKDFGLTFDWAPKFDYIGTQYMVPNITQTVPWKMRPWGTNQGSWAILSTWFDGEWHDACRTHESGHGLSVRIKDMSDHFSVELYCQCCGKCKVLYFPRGADIGDALDAVFSCL